MSDYRSDRLKRIEAEAKKKERILKARSELSSSAQLIDAFFSGIAEIISSEGCVMLAIIFFITLLAILAFLTPELFQNISWTIN